MCLTVAADARQRGGSFHSSDWLRAARHLPSHHMMDPLHPTNTYLGIPFQPFLQDIFLPLFGAAILLSTFYFFEDWRLGKDPSHGSVPQSCFSPNVYQRTSFGRPVWGQIGVGLGFFACFFFARRRGWGEGKSKRGRDGQCGAMGRLMGRRFGVRGWITPCCSLRS